MRYIALVLLVLFTLAPIPANAGKKGLMIPWYPMGDPLGIFPSDDLDRLIMLAQKYPNVPIIIEGVGESGPSIYGQHFRGAPPNPGKLVAIQRMQAVGIKVIGYIECTTPITAADLDAGSGQPTVARTKEVIDDYYTSYPSIDGIFIDEYAVHIPPCYGRSTDWPQRTVDFYNQINAYIKSKGGIIVGNSNAFDLESNYLDYFSATYTPDYFNVWESNSDVNFTTVSHAPVPSSRKTAIVYSMPTRTDAQIRNVYTGGGDPTKAVDWLYYRDQYDWTTLPPNLEQQMAVASAINIENGYPITATPTPAVSRATMSASFR